MPRITLPDGSVREYGAPVTAARVAADIGAGLAKAAVGAKIDGELADLSAPIERDATLAIITEPRKNQEADPDALYLLRHSAGCGFCTQEHNISCQPGRYGKNCYDKYQPRKRR